jgi:excinuclease UvrABC ATPase subunit
LLQHRIDGRNIDVFSGMQIEKPVEAPQSFKEPEAGTAVATLRERLGHLVEIMNCLVDEGNTVVVIEYNSDIMRNADWNIDMGPVGGNRGGKVLFEGAPAELKSCKESLTAEYI